MIYEVTVYGYDAEKDLVEENLTLLTHDLDLAVNYAKKLKPSLEEGGVYEHVAVYECFKQDGSVYRDSAKFMISYSGVASQEDLDIENEDYSELYLDGLSSLVTQCITRRFADETRV